ncbi:MAG: EamA family transporter [Acidiferrobacterales bacterium]|nr:EamA family transporter [Acidiferrobacterales bacterium]
MYGALLLLAAVTFFYAGYNLLIKISSSHIPVEATSTIAATITLQTAALLVSCVFVAGLLIRGNTILAVPPPALMWAALAGICIGAAEIGYFYLLRGGLSHEPVAASTAIPIIVGGTILIALLLSWLWLRESMNWTKAMGAVTIIAGVALMFVETDS